MQAPGRLRTGWARRQPGTSPSFNIWTFLWLNKWRKTVTPIKSRWQTLKKFLMQFSQVCSLLKYYNSNNMQGLTPHIQYSICIAALLYLLHKQSLLGRIYYIHKICLAIFITIGWSVEDFFWSARTGQLPKVRYDFRSPNPKFGGMKTWRGPVYGALALQFSISKKSRGLKNYIFCEKTCQKKILNSLMISFFKM